MLPGDLCWPGNSNNAARPGPHGKQLTSQRGEAGSVCAGGGGERQQDYASVYKMRSVLNDFPFPLAIE